VSFLKLEIKKSDFLKKLYYIENEGAATIPLFPIFAHFVDNIQNILIYYHCICEMEENNWIDVNKCKIFDDYDTPLLHYCTTKQKFILC